MIAETVTLPAGSAELHGDLRVPARAIGVVVFAHGSGSSRFSARNRSVAAALEAHGLGTFLLDLLTAAEEHIDARTAEFRFDIPRLAARVVQACDWLTASADRGAVPGGPVDGGTVHGGSVHGRSVDRGPARPGPLDAGLARLATLPIGCFGASTGAAAALIAAAERPERVRAVVSRGGRPDLAGDALELVRAPTLLIVGGADRDVIELNRQASARLRAPVELAIVPRATHLFEEPGALAQVAALTAEWFTTHLRA